MTAAERPLAITIAHASDRITDGVDTLAHLLAALPAASVARST